MKTINYYGKNGVTKTGEKMYIRACNTEGYTLFDVYGSYSWAKQNAYDWCFEQFLNTPNTYDFRIISHNTHGFSVAWDIVDPENGNISAIRIETPYNSYLLIL